MRLTFRTHALSLTHRASAAGRKGKVHNRVARANNHAEQIRGTGACIRMEEIRAFPLLEYLTHRLLVTPQCCAGSLSVLLPSREIAAGLRPPGQELGSLVLSHHSQCLDFGASGRGPGACLPFISVIPGSYEHV